MPRILITWEIGENYGHVLPYIPFARELRDRGHEVIFVLRDVRMVSGHLEAEGFKALQAPFHPDGPVPQGNQQPCNAAEILALFGFTNPPVLGALVSAWRALYGLINPHLVVASYAPVSLLAARMDRIPTVLMALGFELPPSGMPMPSLRPWLPLPAERHAQAARRVVEAVNAVAGDSGLRVEAFGDIFTADRTYLNTWEELDHYPLRPNAHYSGPLFNASTGNRPVWPTDANDEATRVFAYLRPGMAGFAAVLKTLASLPCRSVVSAPGMSATQMRNSTAPNVAIERGPVHLGAALEACDVVVTYAGHGMAAAGLAAGRPMLMLPQNLEQFLLSRRLEEQGVAFQLAKPDEESIASVLKRLAHEPAFRQRSMELASRHAGYDPERRSREIAAEIELFLEAA